MIAEEYMDAERAAAYLGVCKETIFRWTRGGRLKAYQQEDGLGKGWRRYLFHASDLERVKGNRTALKQV